MTPAEESRELLMAAELWQGLACPPRQPATQTDSEAASRADAGILLGPLCGSDGPVWPVNSGENGCAGHGVLALTGSRIRGSPDSGGTRQMSGHFSEHPAPSQRTDLKETDQALC